MACAGAWASPAIPAKANEALLDGVSEPWRAYLVKAREAERIEDPLQRCLAFPDLPDNSWPAGHATGADVVVLIPVAGKRVVPRGRVHRHLQRRLREVRGRLLEASELLPPVERRQLDASEQRRADHGRERALVAGDGAGRWWR